MPTLLVVDDYEEVRTLTREVLESGGYKVIEACDGAEAVKLVAEHPEITLAIVDVWLPDVAGDLLVRFLREQRPGLKAVLMTGYAADIVAKRGLKVEAPILFKPHHPKELLQMVTLQLESRT